MTLGFRPKISELSVSIVLTDNSFPASQNRQYPIPTEDMSITDHPQPDGPVVVQLSDEERESGQVTPINLLEAIDAFFRDGVVVLANAIQVDLVDRLNERMKRDTEELLRNEGKIHWK